MKSAIEKSRFRGKACILFSSVRFLVFLFSLSALLSVGGFFPAAFSSSFYLNSFIRNSSLADPSNIGFSILNSSIEAAPAPISIERRVSEADLILLVQVEGVELTDFNEISKHANLHLRVLQAFKGKDIPSVFDLAFLVFPETLENHLREPVPKGRYIVFLKRKKIPSMGKDVLVLLEPRVFAFVDDSPFLRKTISSLLERPTGFLQGGTLPCDSARSKTATSGFGYLHLANMPACKTNGLLEPKNRFARQALPMIPPKGI